MEYRHCNKHKDMFYFHTCTGLKGLCWGLVNSNIKLSNGLNYDFEASSGGIVVCLQVSNVQYEKCVIGH